jgi:hypothetical protein
MEFVSVKIIIQKLAYLCVANIHLNVAISNVPNLSG